MTRLWKHLWNNHLIYWRFRYVTRNRLRLQSWFRSRQLPSTPLRPRGGAAYVYHRTGRRSWIALLVMVALLTALSVLGGSYGVSAGLVSALGLLVIVGALYWALRGI